MPTTPNYAWPYPGLTDPPHGPNQIGGLALAIDTSLKADADGLAAAVVRLDALEARPRGIVASFTREDATPTTTTTLRAFHISVPVLAGRTYRVWTNSVAMFSTAAGDDVAMEVRHTTAGGVPTTASPILPGGVTQDRCQSTANGLFLPLSTKYPAATNHTLRLALCVTRKSGSGQVSLFGGGPGSPYVIQLNVEDIGATVAEAGTLN